MNGREVDWNNPGIVVKGIDEATGKPNTTNVDVGGLLPDASSSSHEPYVYDDSWIKLRELRVGYDLPTRVANKLFAPVGEHRARRSEPLDTWTKVPNIDPEFAYTTGNYQGIEFAALPNARSFGFNIRLTP